MIAMIFEYWVDENHREAYQQQSARMRQLVNEIDGFISIETYHSKVDPSKTLALGFFRDEDAVTEWRNVIEHRKAQVLGRRLFFTDYRLRMAEVVRDYSMHNRDQAPQDSRAKHDVNKQS